MNKVIVEGGWVGVLLWAAIFLATLRRSSRILGGISDPVQRRRALLLRYSYVGFFVAGMIQLSHFHWLLMGLIDSDSINNYGRSPSPNSPEPKSGRVL